MSRLYKKYYSVPMHQVINEYYELTNGHWFDKDTMRFFQSRLPRRALLVNNTYYFISSECHRYSEKGRRYTIRAMNSMTGDISTISDFQEFNNRREAEVILSSIIKQKRI